MTNDPANPPATPETRSHAAGARRGLAERPPSWPLVIGILGCVLGGFGILGGLWGFVAYALADTIAASLPPEAGAAFQALGEYKGLGMLATAVGLCLAVVLLIGSIGLTRRRASAPPLLLGWSIFQAIFSLPSAYLQYLINRRQFEIMPEQPPGLDDFSTIVSVAAIGMGLVWAWALPVFLLIWFSRQNVRDEIASWSPEESGMLGE